MKKNTVATILKKKENNEKISVLTAYDYMWANLLDEAGIDVLLVGDSLGMVVLGYETTLQVTMEDMIRHTQAVHRGSNHALILVDMPFMSYATVEDGLKNAGRLMSEGFANAVKLEGGKEIAPLVKKIVDAGIPVCAHIGIRPQSVHIQGYKTQGILDEERKEMLEDAIALEKAGAFMIVIEKVEHSLAKEITETLSIPTIGIGSGKYCDGQVLVIHDILGLFDKFVPPFVKQYANLKPVIVDKVKEYIDEVKESKFPS